MHGKAACKSRRRKKGMKGNPTSRRRGILEYLSKGPNGAHYMVVETTKLAEHRDCEK